MECALCSQPVRDSYSIQEGVSHFCCHGCHAVFKILSGQGQTENYLEHPLFRQAVDAGLISNPELLKHLQERENKHPPKDLRKLHFEVEDMWCLSCAEVIRLILLQQPGVRRCVVDYATDLACVDYDPMVTGKEEIFSLVKKIGYGALPFQDYARRTISKTLYFRFVIAGFCALNIMMFAYPLYATYFSYDSEGYGDLFAWLSGIVALPVITYCAWPIYRRFANGLRFGLIGMEALATVGIVAASVYSYLQLWRENTDVYFDSMSVVVALMLFGKIIESKAKMTTKESLWHLNRSLPRRGRKLLPDGNATFVPVKEIEIGNLVIVNAGEKIVVDGTVREGEGTCDESLMTGESLPIFKKVGHQVIGGTFLRQGSLTIQTDKLATESSLYRLVEQVEQELGNKAAYERPADKIVGWFVPAVFAIALFTALIAWWQGSSEPLLAALPVLLISCPCALGIAAPLAESYLIHRLAELGAIVRNRACLKFLGKETVYVFDKTGTVTEGKFHVLKGLEHLSEEDKRALKTLVMHSNHPIAMAIDEKLSVAPGNAWHVHEIPGQGLSGGSFVLGSDEFLRSKHISIEEQVEEGITRVFFAEGKRLIGAIDLGDPVREELPELIQSLNAQKTLLLSGDSVGAVRAAAEACGFQKWQARCSPLQKREEIVRLKEEGSIVSMIGDGINDALALGEAHVAMTVVSAADVSIQVSDVMLTTDKLSILPQVFQLSSHCRAIIAQNLFWAFFYNVIGIGLAVMGWLNPVFAAAAMTLSSLIVLLNARRLLR